MDTKTRIIEGIARFDNKIKKAEEDIALHKKQCRHLKDYEAQSNYIKSMLKTIKLERLIFVTVLKGPNPILDLYLEKFQEILSDTHQFSSDLVKSGFHSENDHLEWCSKILEKQKYIKNVCDYFKN
jgi:hypothetical protein